MATTSESKRTPDYSDRRNAVLKVTDVTLKVFSFTNDEGRIGTAMAFCFGTDKSDGKPGVWVIDPTKMQELLTIPHPHIKKAIREALVGEGEVAPAALPSLDAAFMPDEEG